MKVLAVLALAILPLLGTSSPDLFGPPDDRWCITCWGNLV